MTSATDLQALQDLSSQFESKIKSRKFNSQRYGRFELLFQIEKEFTEKLGEMPCKETIEKAEQLFQEFVESIVESGFCVNMRLYMYEPAIHEAAKNNCPLSLRALVLNGADINSLSMDSFGDNPLKKAVEYDAIRAAEMIIRLGGDVNLAISSSSSCTNALHYATSSKMVHLLVEKGADVNEKCMQHGSALHQAASNCSPAMVAVLLEQGANDDDFVREGKRTALDIVKDYIELDYFTYNATVEDARECVRLLEKA